MTSIRVAALVVVVAAAGAVRAADGVPWHSVTETAAAVADAQKKLLLVYYPASCNGCALEKLFENAMADDVFVRVLDAFLPLRLTSPTGPIGKELAKEGRPVVAFYDSYGVKLAVAAPDISWANMVEEMLRFRGERLNIVRSTELRFAKRIPEADYVLGGALLNTSALRVAALRLERAMKAFREAGDEASAQAAQVFAGAAIYRMGRRPEGRQMLLDVIRNPANDTVAARAHIEIGRQHEAAALRSTSSVPPTKSGIAMGTWTVTQHTDMREMARALEAYRKAYELAPAGSFVLEQATHALTRIDQRPLAPKGGTDALLRIIAPSRRTIVGDADFLVQSRAGLARVDFYLDNKKVGSVSKQPFRQSIDVGKTPVARTVKAIGFDAQGNATGEAVVTINDRIDAFIVSIVAPAETWISGAKDVELALKVPPARSVARVELSWNGKEFATLKARPFRARMNATANEFGYLRALAVLDDGTTAEATKVYNSLGVSESVEVGAVTVIATITDKKGERINDLKSGDFVVADEGKRVAAELRSSLEDPVTIGIAIDSSSSLRGRQLYIIRAARAFLSHALRPQDQAFVVGFDTEPRLVHGRSSDARSLSDAVFELTPAGGTSIFDGVTLALQQFQGIPGKKALLVFTDGMEGVSSASAGECERLARTVGVPVYVVVPPEGERHHNALNGIARDTGGTMFFDLAEETFAEVFDRLAAEMRGQYVLSFTRPAGIKAGSWRSIRVTVPARDANVRTIQGYRAN
ncbi:MAG TPA: VWA domain-containing protein [Thermoanaerobaculia bacterium]|nr:VWA domain-containing protein [Thermoanaerobaculia bacterium]